MMDNSYDATESAVTDRLLEDVACGKPDALDALLGRHRAYLKRLLDVRIDGHLRRRVDPSDVVQEALIVAQRRIREFIDRRPVLFRVWLRQLALERWIDIRRTHQRRKRDSRRESPTNDTSAIAIAAHLLGERPSEQLIRQEVVRHVQDVLESLEAADREVLLLRHAEMLSNAETAEILGISTAAASKRYGRAIARLASELHRLGFSRA